MKQDKRAYEILLLRDQHGTAFPDLAIEFGISLSRVEQIYNRIKMKQTCLYLQHLANVLGQEHGEQITKLYWDANECYQERVYACAYLEKKYRDILAEYRNGEPGMPPQFIRNMPPFRVKLSQKTIARVIEMREKEKASFETIGKELHITRKKARHTYQHFYHEQVLELIRDLQEKAESGEEKRAIWEYYFRGFRSSKKRYDMLMKNS